MTCQQIMGARRGRLERRSRGWGGLGVSYILEPRCDGYDDQPCSYAAMLYGPSRRLLPSAAAVALARQ
jgi:hypothetical protein